MPLEIYLPRVRVHPALGPPKLRIEPGDNGRCTIYLSALVRDHLRPTLPASEGRRNGPSVLKVVLFVDPQTRVLQMQRSADDSEGEHVLEVRGLGTNGRGTAYITTWYLTEALGIEGGAFRAELVTGEDQTPAIRINCDDPLENPSDEPEPQLEETPEIEQTPLTPEQALCIGRAAISAHDEQRIAAIREVLDEGITHLLSTDAERARARTRHLQT